MFDCPFLSTYPASTRTIVLYTYPALLLLHHVVQLDAESVAWLEQYLQEFKGTVVAITHDRYFLENSCGWILELDRGKGR